MINRVVSTELGKYIIAGSLAFSSDMLVLYICTDIVGLHYLVSNIFGYTTGLCVSYWLNVKWVFLYRRYNNAKLEFIVFTVIIVVGLGLSEALMYFFVETFELYYLYAKVFATAVVFLFKYLAKKFILFHQY